MAWSKIDDGMPQHPRFLGILERLTHQLADDAGREWCAIIGMWTVGLCEIARNRLDGEISPFRWRRAADLDQDTFDAYGNELSMAGLIEPTENGWRYILGGQLAWLHGHADKESQCLE